MLAFSLLFLLLLCKRSRNVNVINAQPDDIRWKRKVSGYSLRKPPQPLAKRTNERRSER